MSIVVNIRTVKKNEDDLTTISSQATNASEECVNATIKLLKYLNTTVND
jgi:hypothetical protein